MLLVPTSKCTWCDVPVGWKSENKFVDFCLERYGEEMKIPIHLYLRKYYCRNKRSSSLCHSCRSIDMRKWKTREITGRCPLAYIDFVKHHDYADEFEDKMYDQRWFHQCYKDYMWMEFHSYDAFIEVIEVREFLVCGEYIDVEEYFEELPDYYEEMVRSHLRVDEEMVALWDEDFENIEGFITPEELELLSDVE